MRRGDAVAVLDRDEAGSAVYNVVLLAGSPMRLVLRLPANLARESLIEVDGGTWLVADVRPSEGGPPQLICIHADERRP